jgi:hypothetical protein
LEATQEEEKYKVFGKKLWWKNKKKKRQKEDRKGKK